MNESYYNDSRHPHLAHKVPYEEKSMLESLRELLEPLRPGVDLFVSHWKYPGAPFHFCHITLEIKKYESNGEYSTPYKYSNSMTYKNILEKEKTENQILTEILFGVFQHAVGENERITKIINESLKNGSN